MIFNARELVFLSVLAFVWSLAQQYQTKISAVDQAPQMACTRAAPVALHRPGHALVGLRSPSALAPRPPAALSQPAGPAPISAPTRSSP